jgi:hypothetical protein
MAPSARKSVLEIKKGVDPATTDIFNHIPQTGTTSAWVAFSVPWFPNLNTTLLELRRT